MTMTSLPVFNDHSDRGSTIWAAADCLHAADGIQGSYDNLEDYLTTLG
jgi:hypothetical protein